MCNHHVAPASSSGDEEDDEITVRCKWQMDGARTLDEAVEKLHGFIEYLQRLRDDGYELISPVDDDWGFVRRAGDG